MVLIGSGIGAIAGALIGVVIHMVGRVRKLEEHRTVANTLLVDHGARLEAQKSGVEQMWGLDAMHFDLHDERIRRLEQRSDARARYIRTTVTAGERWAVLTEHRLAKLDRAGHRHEEMGAEKPKYHVCIDGKDMPPKPDKPRT